MIENIAQAEKYLSQFYDRSWQITGKDITLERMWPLLDKVGNPHESLKVVHIAGTSGKTSTSYFISSLLTQSGKRVGLTVSPHISSITERLQINGLQLSDSQFCSRLKEFIELLGEDPDTSYFEFIITFVLWVFKQENVDYAVLETGLGGMYDCTNVCQRNDKVCVITDIGYDHQNVLGNSLGEIATQKAGIIHNGNQVFMYDQSIDIMSSVRKRVEDVSATLNIVEFDKNQTLTKDLVDYQKRNWQLSKSVYDYISMRDGLKILNDIEIRHSQVSVPGRMQPIKVNKTTLVLDGAHNTQKMQAFVDSFKSSYPSLKVPVLLAIKDDKDYKSVIDILVPITSKIFVTSFSSNQDIKVKSVDPYLVSEVCRQKGIETAIVGVLSDAINVLLNENEPVCIVTGSLYLLGSVIDNLDKLNS